MSREATGRGRGDSAPGRSELRAATVGSVVESFDWNIYAVLAPFFAVTVFGTHGPGALLAAYAGFAVGFLARPLGGAALGRFSDRFGRRTGLVLSMGLIAGAGLCLAVVPGAGTVGLWSGVFVVLLRLVQGFAFGGEGSAVMAYVTEAAPPGRRFRYSAVSYSGVACGSLLAFAVAAGLTAVLGRRGLAEGGWRWGFALAAAAGLVAVWVRLRAPESGAFEAERAAHGTRRPPLLQLVREYRAATAAVALLAVAGTVPLYFALVYFPVYGDAVGVVDKADASGVMTAALAVVVVAVLGSGVVLDRVGFAAVLRIAFAVQLVATVPLLALMRSGAVPFGVAAVLLGVALAPSLAVGNVISALLFPTGLRAVGSGIATSAAIALFGGTLPLLAEWLRGHGAYGALPFYVAAAALCGLLGVRLAVRCGAGSVQ